MQIGGGELTMHLGDAFGNQPGELVRVHLDAAVRRGAHLVGNLLAKPFHLASTPVKQQRAHR